MSHGTDLVRQGDDGLPLYQLYERTEQGWVPRERGTSTVIETGEAVEQWRFWFAGE